MKTRSRQTLRTILIYGAALAAGSLGLQWLQYKLLIRAHPMEAWLVLLAVAFMALGIWVGVRLSHRRTVSEFEPNVRARETLGISDRELEVLELLAAGQSNKEIANQLKLSPNTVKTHIARLFDKLEVRRRTEAILRARELGMIR